MPTMVVRTLVALLLALVGVVAAPSSVACACSCMGLDTDEAMARASAVFDGEVVARTKPSGGFSGELIEYTIEVSRVYQGSVPTKVIVRSAAESASCGAELSGRVTVFAHGPVEDLQTTLCSAPVTLDRSKLGAGSPPTSSPIEEPPSGFDPGLLAFSAVAGVVVLIGVSVWLTRRRRT